MPILLNFRGAKQFIADMSEDALETARLSILWRAKEKAFAKRLPIYFSTEGKLMAEYADGRVEIAQ